MARRKTRTFTEVELEFMQIIWELGTATPDDIQNALSNKGRKLTGGSIRNVLAIMGEKGYVTRKKRGKTYLWRAKIHKEQAQRSMVEHLLSSAFEGSESLLVSSILNNRDIHNEEIKEIEHLIANRKQRTEK